MMERQLTLKQSSRLLQLVTLRRRYARRASLSLQEARDRTDRSRCSSYVSALHPTASTTKDLPLPLQPRDLPNIVAQDWDQSPTHHAVAVVGTRW